MSRSLLLEVRRVPDGGLVVDYGDARPVLRRLLADDGPHPVPPLAVALLRAAQTMAEHCAGCGHEPHAGLCRRPIAGHGRNCGCER